jgi:oxygen-independent coproporphyrinogen-3 oxidase
MAGAEHRFAIDFREYFAASWPDLERLVADGIITIDEQHIAATSRGRYLLRIIAMCFDRYLQPECESSKPATFSKAI